MSLLTVHDQVEQARAYIDALQNKANDPQTAAQEQICAELQKINLRLSALVSDVAAQRETLPTWQSGFGDIPLETILDKLTSVAVVYDQNGVVQIANRYARVLFSFDPTQMQREALFGKLAIHDEQGNPVLPDQMPASRASRGETVEDMRLVITNPQGRVFHVMATATQVTGDSGIAGVISIWNDYTEHKQAEAALEKAHTEMINEKNRLLAVMEALPIGVAICDEQGGITHANHGYDEVWGSPRPPTNSVDEYTAYQAWWVENGQPVQPEEWAAAQAVKQGKTVINQFFEIQRFDGRRAFVLNSGAPVYDAQEHIVGSAVAVRDITERVQAERALRVSEERFRVALASLPMTVYTLDRDFRYTWIYNPQLGITEQQLLGKRNEEIFPQTTPEFLVEQRSVIETGRGIRREQKILVQDEWRSFLLSMEPLRDAHQRIIGLIGTLLDLTEQRRIETEHNEVMLQMELQRLLLEHREKERQEIAREIHDGPIQSIVAQMFKLHASRESIADPQALSVLDETAAGLRDAVQELRDVVNEMRPPVLIRFGLARAIQIHSEDFRGKYQNIKLDLDLVEDANLLPEETCLALYRIYQESLNNVLRHSEASVISVRYYPSRGNMVLEIKDNGKGFVPPTDWVRMTRGNHFGLAGMRERVDAIGGKLSIISRPGEGAQVCVRVPLPPAKA